MSAPDLAAAGGAPWPELDRRFLHIDRRSVPPLFLPEVFPEALRPWIDGHTRSSTCVLYIALALLAAVSATCGSRFVVDVTVDPGCVRWQVVRTPFLSRFRSVFSRLLQRPTAAKCRGNGLLAHRPSETPIKNGENGRYGQKRREVSASYAFERRSKSALPRHLPI